MSKLKDTIKKVLLNEVSGSDHDDYDEYRGQMARVQLKSIVEKATGMLQDIQDDTQLEAWVESKITLAEDYIQTVYDYLKHKEDK